MLFTVLDINVLLINGELMKSKVLLKYVICASEHLIYEDNQSAWITFKNIVILSLFSDTNLTMKIYLNIPYSFHKSLFCHSANTPFKTPAFFTFLDIASATGVGAKSSHIPRLLHALTCSSHSRLPGCCPQTGRKWKINQRGKHEEKTLSFPLPGFVSVFKEALNPFDPPARSS